MHFGVFLEERRPGTSDTAALQETLELAELAEAWGLDGVWLGEIHFNPARSVHSAPIALASFIAARTRRVRVGTAVQVLPLGNPLRIAEEVATVDHLSQGRFDFGIGRSGSPRAYDVLGVPYGESQARFEEALQIIREAWKGEPFSYHGQFFHFEKAVVAPRPYQCPHPPIRMAANSQETFPLVARLGLRAGMGRAGSGPADRRRALLDEIANLSYDDILETRAAFGTATSLTDRLRRLREELGLHGIVAELNPGGLLPLERMRRTLQILTHEVMPALKGL